MNAASSRRGWTATGTLTVALVAGVWVTGFNPFIWDVASGRSLVEGMFPPDWSVLPSVLAKMAETLGIAFLGTVLAFVLAFPFSLLAARGLVPDWAGGPVRALMALLRAVPEILWALFFLAATDLGNIAGIYALAVHNLGILSKLMAEVYETAPAGPQESVASTGAGRLTTIWHGILPWSAPHVLSHTFFRFECNIRTSTVLGVVGAGGIGQLLMIHRALLQYDKMLVDTLGVLVLVLAADALGAILRKQVS